MKQVVVLGGGYAGSRVAVNLDKSDQVHVTLVDNREAMIHKIGGLRAAVDTTWADKIPVPRNKMLKNGTIKVDTAVSISDGKVTLASGEELPYDFLVCATGAQNQSPGEPPSDLRSLEDLIGFYKTSAAEIEKANSYVVIGGGNVGVELCGEIRRKYPKKKIILVHSASTLLSKFTPKLPDSAVKRLQAQLRGLNVEIILGDAMGDVSILNGKSYLTNPGEIVLSSGRTISGDMVFNCMGAKLNTGFYPSEWKDSNGAIKVKNNLMVEGTTNVFACGDLTNFKEAKQAYTANASHGPKVAANILSIINGNKPTKTHKATGRPYLAVPLGEKGGIVSTPFGTMGPYLASKFKGKALFLDISWKRNNLPTPSIK